MRQDGAAALLGLLGLLGWISGLRLLASLRPDYKPMAPDSAFLFVLLGSILLRHLHRPWRGRGRSFALVVMALASIYGLLKLVEYLLGVDLTFSGILFPVTEYPSPFLTGRMSPITGALFCLSGCALALNLWAGDKGITRQVAAALASLILAAGFVGATGYLYGTPLLYGSSIIPLAVTTTLAFFMLGGGLLAAAGPGSVMLRPLLGGSVRARLLRVFLPLTVLMVLAQGFLSRELSRSSSLNLALVLALWSLVFMVMAGVAVTLAARSIGRALDRANVEREQAEEALRRERDLLSRIMEASPVGITIVDREGQITFANAQAERVLGLTRDELTQRTYNAPAWQITDYEGRPFPDEELPFRRVMATGQPVYGVRHAIEWPDGRRVLLDINAAPLFDTSGQVDGMVAVVADVTEQVRVQEALRAERDLTAGLLDTVGALVVVLDRQGCIVRFNCACEQTTGYSFEEVGGKHVWDLFLIPEDLEPVKAVFGKLRAGDFPSEYENYWVAKDGRRRLITWSNTALLGREGAVEYVIGTGLDITEHKRAEEALRASEKRLSLIFDTVGDVIFLLAVEPEDCFRFLSVNPAFLAVTGLTREQVVGKRMEEVLPETAHVLVLGKYKEAIRENKIVRWEEVSAYPTGTLYGEVAVTPAWDAAGVCTHLIGSVHDITEIRRGEGALRQERDLLGRVMETSPVGITVLDREGRITFANAPAEQVLGLTRDKITQRTYNAPEWRITDYEGRPFPEEELPFRRVMAAGQPAYDVRHAIEWPDGRRKLLEINAAPLSDASGQVDGMVAVVADITEQERAREMLRESEERYHSLFVSSLDAVLLTAPDGSILAANPAACEMFGRTEEELKQVGRGSVVDTSDPRLAVALEERARTGKVRSELTLIRKDGSKFPAEISSVLFTDRDGQLRTSMVTRDVTERKRAEQALRDTQTFLNSIIEQSPYAMWISDESGTLIRLNPACCDLLHITAEEVVGKYNVLRDSLVEEQGFLPLVKAVFEEGSTAQFVIAYDSSRLKHLKLERAASVTLDVTISPIRDATGRITNAVIQHVDITERKRAEEALRESEEKFSKVFRSSPDSITLTSLATGLIVEANESASTFTGYSHDELIGKNTTELNVWVNLSDRDRYVALLQKHGRVHDLEAGFRIKSGEKKTALVSGEIIELRDGKYILSVLRDVTERKRAEEVIRQQLAMLSALYSGARGLVESLDQQKVTESVVRTCVETLGTRLAWLGRAEADGSVRVLTQSPSDSAYLGQITVRWDDSPLGQGPMGRAIRNGSPVIAADLRTLPGFAPWREAALAAGFLSAAAFPLVSHGRPFGALNLASDQVGFFTPERVELFQAFADQVAAALENARLFAEVRGYAAELERRVAERTAALQAANQELEAFSYSISHDLRAPLRALDGFSRILLEEHASQLADEPQRYLRLLRQNAQQMGRLIDDLLTFSR